MREANDFVCGDRVLQIAVGAFSHATVSFSGRCFVNRSARETTPCPRFSD